MKKGLIYGVIGAMALGMASCSSDEPAGVIEEVIKKDETRYLTVALATPTNYMSKADFENGTSDESAVNTLIFVFYDGSGAPTATHYVVPAAQLTQGWTENTDGNNVTRFWTSTIPVNMTQGQNKPVYVMCFVNPVETAGLERMTLSEIDALKRSSIYGETAGFAMSNSVYYGQNTITGQSDVRVMATPINDGYLWPTEDEAKANPALDIYVERYAAKIGLTLEPTAIQAYPVLVAGANGALTEGSIKFTPAYWRANAIDMTLYVTKGFNTTAEGSDPTQPATYSAMTVAFQNSGMPGEGLSGWNNAGNHRSYWACSPSYYAEDYPQVSDNITDVWTEGVSADEDYPYEVKYFSYNECAAANANAIKWDNRFTLTNTGAKSSGYIYTRETTASINMLTKEGINNKAIPASAVIVGNYQLTGATGNPATFYLYGKSEGKDIYYTDANIEQALISNQNVIFTDDQGKNRAESPDYYVIEHPSAEVRNGQNVAGRLVTLQITAEQAAANNLYFYNNDKFEKIGTTNLVAANQLLWSSASSAQKFYQGLAFFAIPIRHLGWGKNVEVGKELLIEGAGAGAGRPSMINWQNLRVGDLGVVRNHVYTIEVTGVQGLGVGLGSATQPMVPPMDPDNYYIAAKLNILAWRVVPSQSVVL